jgi:rhodanese-related sulfurtransferase
MTPAEAEAALAAGAVPLDLRLPRVFAREHVPGAVNLQFNRADLADRAEMALPKDISIVIIAEPEAVAKAAAEILSAAGYSVGGHVDGGLKAWKAAGLPTEAIEILGVDDLKARAEMLQVLDAREGFEFRHGHVPGAALFPWTDAWTRVGEVASSKPLAVVCGDEVRSSFVASVLRRARRDVSLVVGGMADWLERGYPVDKGAATS